MAPTLADRVVLSGRLRTEQSVWRMLFVSVIALVPGLGALLVVVVNSLCFDSGCSPVATTGYAVGGIAVLLVATAAGGLAIVAVTRLVPARRGWSLIVASLCAVCTTAAALVALWTLAILTVFL